MEFYSIKSNEDIQYFLDKTNGLHDGYFVSVQYINNGIQKNSNCICPEKTKLIIQILVTSICDTLVEIEFENVLEWQMHKNTFNEILDTSISFNDKGFVVWSDDIVTEKEDIQGCSYAIAKSMKWRIVS